MKRDLGRAVVCIVGLGYVGLPLARAFSRSLKVIGFDTDPPKISYLNLILSFLKGDGATQASFCRRK